MLSNPSQISLRETTELCLKPAAHLLVIAPEHHHHRLASLFSLINPAIVDLSLPQLLSAAFTVVLLNANSGLAATFLDQS